MSDEPAFDLGRVADWMAARGLRHGELVDGGALRGGTQNLLRALRDDTAQFVLRARLGETSDLAREATVLQALQGSKVPHPRLLGYCADTTVIGRPFYLMESIDGLNLSVDPPRSLIEDASALRSIAISVVDALVELGGVDLSCLEEVVPPVTEAWLDRQVGRWMSQLASYAATPGYDTSSLAGATELGTWLTTHRPSTMHTGLMHGDYHLANILVRPAEHDVAAIVDWELSTGGDPLLDLAHLVMMWPRGDRPKPYDFFPGTALPPTADLIAHYEMRTGRDLEHFTWYEVLARFRFAIILEGSLARAIAGRVSPRTGERLHAIALDLIRQGLEMTAT